MNTACSQFKIIVMATSVRIRVEITNKTKKIFSIKLTFFIFLNIKIMILIRNVRR